MRATEIAAARLNDRARLVAAVREAGLLALKFHRQEFKSWIKHGTSPVSEVDIAINDLLRDRLVSASEDGWLSEESENDPIRLQKRRVWVVDPIDGTKAYIAGREDWTISAALVEDGRPTVAALFAPATDELFVAVEGQGATRNATPIAARPGSAVAGIKIAGPRRVLESMAIEHPELVIVPRIHSLALRLARAAQGEIDAAIAGGNSHDWDLAAADLLVHEAGGLLTSLEGSSLIYNRANPVHDVLVASGRERHSELLELVRAKYDQARIDNLQDHRIGKSAMPEATAKNKQLLHLVFGGELSKLGEIEFKDLERLDIVGIYPNYATAYAAWKAKAQQTVDNAEIRYFIVHLHRLLEPDAVESPRTK